MYCELTQDDYHCIKVSLYQFIYWFNGCGPPKKITFGKNRKKNSACRIFAAIISIISITATIGNTVIVILIAVHWLADFSDPRINNNKIVLIIHGHLFAWSKCLSRHRKVNDLFMYCSLYTTGLCAWVARSLNLS